MVCSALVKILTEAFGVEIPDTEDCYLKICLSGLRFHVPMEKEQSLKEKRERNQEMFDFMMELLMECDRKFYLQLAGDDELISALMDHLECMVLRLRQISRKDTLRESSTLQRGTACRRNSGGRT